MADASRRKIPSTVTQKAVASFFTPASQKSIENLVWQTRGTGNTKSKTLLLGRYLPSSSTPVASSSSLGTGKTKIAAFDLDSTLIATASGLKFPRNSQDWKWWHSSVPSRLHKLCIDDGYQVAIISNQAGLSMASEPGPKYKNRLPDFKTKVASILRQLDIPIYILAATENDTYRKPRTGMWTELLKELGCGEADNLDLQGSFFVGDAAGREATGSRQKDHSCSDRNFAENLGITFSTPEEFFLGEKASPFVRIFEPSEYVGDSSVQITQPPYVKINSQDIVLLCGSPGAGKSSWYWRNLEPLGYSRINQDNMRSLDKCLKVAAQELEQEKSVAIDNTNADMQVRSKWIALAAQHDIPIRCVHLMTPSEICVHNGAVRALNEMMNPEKRTKLPAIAFHTFHKKFQAPQLDEGFQDLTEVAFKFQGSEVEKKIWNLHWN